MIVARVEFTVRDGEFDSAVAPAGQCLQRAFARERLPDARVRPAYDHDVHLGTEFGARRRLTFGRQAERMRRSTVKVDRSTIGLVD